MLKIFFIGVFMGAADLVPGISGGTVAFILGIYERLINAIKGFGTKNGDLKFLLVLISGIACSILSLSHVLEILLNDPELRTFLYSAFLGMILGSTIFCSKQVRAWSNSRFCGLALGIICSFMLTGHLAASAVAPVNNLLWVSFCGAVAISAMLLPGISGSYLLTILGLFPLVIHNLNTFTAGIVSGNFEFASFEFLSFLALGILGGALIFSRVVSWSLRNYHDMTISTLTGFMLGGLQTVWPFWIYDTTPHFINPEKGMVLVPRSMTLPDLSSNVFLFGVLFVALGFFWILWMEWMVTRKKISEN